MSSIRKKYPHLTRPTREGATPETSRPEILQAVDITLERYIRGERVTGHSVPPRVGKSSIARILAMECVRLGAPFVIHLSPWTNLVEQITDAVKTSDMMKIYGINGTPMILQAIHTIADHKFYERVGGTRVDLFATTMQLVNANKDKFVNAIAYAAGEKPDPTKRPVVILDECHLISQGIKKNSNGGGDLYAWNETVVNLFNAGAYVVSMTGTSDRADKQAIPGFKIIEKEPFDIGEKAIPVGKEEIDGKTLSKLEIRKGIRTPYSMVPIGGVDVPWGVAWAKKWMAPLNVVKLDFPVLSREDGETNSYSTLPPSIVSKNMTSILRDKDYCIPFAVEATLGRLIHRRKIKKGKKTQALIVTGSDNEREDESGVNYHARQVKRELDKQFQMLSRVDRKTLGELVVKIVTTKNNDGSDNKKAADEIKAFMRGDIDILIVKTMALVGLDAPQCKINTMLSSIRNGPMFLQAITRQLTIWKECDTAGDLIIPWDCYAKAIIEKLREAGAELQVDSWETLRVEYKEPQEGPDIPDEFLEIGKGFISGYTDNAGHVHAGEEEELIFLIREKFRVFSLTDPEVLDLYTQGAFEITQAEKKAHAEKTNETQTLAIDLGEELKTLRGKFGPRCNDIANRRYNYKREPTEWKLYLRQVQDLIKHRCGVAHTPVPNIEDVAVLKQLMEVADQVERELGY